ncbi:acylneuraminate cytidylyltransferase family protein [Citrifermentans bremense]|uniref:acylneuraminate cytidylyltransferase family protein n=1 Tax=Citrifermentans bremense TaxID=60035 RepID=UPI00040CD206|nr:acylneuraminate cytidylyltransferase family protein [Citrifermentans bremense]
MSQKVTALLPMRQGSERVPGKNYRSFAGRPLYHHVVETLLAAPLVSEIVIDTDSSFILGDAAQSFPQVRLIERPVHLRGGEVSMNDVLVNTVGQLQAQWYLQTHSTNPLLTAETVNRALNSFFDLLPEYDSLFSVTAIHSRFWDAQGRPVNHDPKKLLRTQDLTPIFEENSNLYLFSADSLKRCGNRIGSRPLMFEIDRLEATDIDTDIDFQVAEILYQRRRDTEGRL